MDDYQWPRVSSEAYQFDAKWPNDVNPNDIVVPFTSHEEENRYRIAQQRRIKMIIETENKHAKMMRDWKIGFNSV